MKNWKRASVFLAILLGVILVSSFVASAIQTSGFSVKMTELKNVTNTGFVYDDTGKPTDVAVNGQVVSGMLFVPSNATASSPAAGICLTHGYLNNWQFQLQNAIELSRRGFVVLVVDQQGHGDNNNAQNWPAGTTPWTDNSGLYQAVQYLYNLDCVDKAKVGVSGHSMGGENTDSLLVQDGKNYAELCSRGPMLTTNGKGLGIISAAVIQGFDPVNAMTPGGPIDFTQWNDDVSVGLLKASDDEFFYANTFPDGTKSRCRDYLQSVHAALFIKTAYTEGDNSSINVANGGVYVNGQLTPVTEGTAVGSPIRAIYQDANEIHPLNHFSIQGAANIVKFFYAAFGTPAGANYIPSGNEVWWLKEAFSTIGLLCFFLLLLPLSMLLLQIPFFADLKAKAIAKAGRRESADIGGITLRPLKSVRKHITYWVIGIISAIFAGVSYCDLYTLGGNYFPRTSWFPQDTTNPVLFWADMVGLFVLAAILTGFIVNYIINKVKHKNDFEAYHENPFLSCVMPTGLAGFLKTLLLSALSVALMYAVVFINWSIWKVDFRFWSFDVKTFDVLRFLPTIVRYLPFFAIFYCISAFANSTYRVKNLPEWATIAINAFMNVIGIAMMIWVNYGKLMATGTSPTFMLPIIVIFPLVAILPIAVVLSRILYKRTGNIWYGAFVTTMLVTVISVVNTAASFGYVVS
jgi:pimeloyl-ACP methyl ester carboxylesterase